ncbi:hypothetical protein G6F57_010700 [Rhizopus arrhizus]|nr:hypothetical protein G6F30_010940 [Rhizopus arrhizus]KAG1411778.1 hypothetical protein G6F58_008381 [Rhizopus delemar]KAG0975994.1 hypothetical protein G6F29_011125 [Rhizopus arrhizus]KAG0993762.1 hypothetical protein G6F28_006381 [Rhizopus arrhizus]KAG1003341.1 hypothetical protein G6F27_011138 [Rhizopus arrhizus]
MHQERCGPKRASFESIFKSITENFEGLRIGAKMTAILIYSNDTKSTNKTVNIYSLLSIVISCQTVVIRHALESAALLFPSIPKPQDRRMAPFLKPQELKTGVGQRFELAVQFVDVASRITYQPKWRISDDVALSSWKFEQDRIYLKKATGRSGLQPFILLITTCQA